MCVQGILAMIILRYYAVYNLARKPSFCDYTDSEKQIISILCLWLIKNFLKKRISVLHWWLTDASNFELFDVLIYVAMLFYSGRSWEPVRVDLNLQWGQYNLFLGKLFQSHYCRLLCRAKRHFSHSFYEFVPVGPIVNFILRRCKSFAASPVLFQYFLVTFLASAMGTLKYIPEPADSSHWTQPLIK